MKSEEVVKLIKERYVFEKGYVTLAECGPPGGGSRYDALAISVFASHGYSVDGFEVKVSRSDFLAEIENPAKSAPLAKWCDRWWMVCPLEVGRPEECPAHWGFLAVSADGTSLRKVRHARASKLVPIRGDEWWATVLLRHASRERFATTELQDAKSKGWTEGYEKAKEHEQMTRKHVDEQLAEAQKAINDFEQASGIRIGRWGNNGRKLGEVVHTLLNRGGLEGIAESIERDAEHLAKMAAGLKTIVLRPDLPAPQVEIQQEKTA